MLKNGEIDLMSDVSWTEERENEMLFSSLPMGTEEYYLFISPTNQEILPGDEQTLQGKTVGVNRGSIQETFFREWAEKYGLNVKLAEVDGTESESLAMLENGELDAYVTVDSFTRPERTVPVYKIGSSDYYFAVNKKRPDLLSDLNMAMNRIQDEDRFYNMRMYEKYIRGAGANIYLSSSETEWLSAHGPIKVGYQDNYLALCAEDKNTGMLTGMLKDYLELAADSIQGIHIDFETIPFSTAEEAINALKRDDVDCVFPANLNGYEAEQHGTVMTPPLLDTEMSAIVRMSDPNIV
jgi:ABC-type amino acid transport substrate-binding protein